ncbi:hypothetical protein, partial [Burkholderia vietnamiensis]|uniref:hypothetical protein n=1 Tax=Burkholderia vietnamiensis TaxID=60552 RepID=UPI001E414143
HAGTWLRGGGSRLRGFRRDAKGCACARNRGLQDVGESRPLRQKMKKLASCGLFHWQRRSHACDFSRPTPYVVISVVLSNFPVTHARFLP